MRGMLELLRRLRFLFRRAEFERDLEEELRHHLSLLEASGKPAPRQFGNITSIQEESRSMWTFAVLEQFVQDLRYALRTMTANPIFTASAVLSLALGIGANTAIYSFMDAILMRALPVAHPEQLVVAEWHAPLFDRVFSTLLDDLADRGLLATTLVVCMGEFGRTPRINEIGSRDHWHQCYFSICAGAGIQPGRTIGESDARGEHPLTDPITPAMVGTTMLELAGINSATRAELRVLTEGRVIHELL